MKKFTLLCILILSNTLFAQFSWQQLNGPQGGIVSQIRGNSSGVLFMGSLGGGMFRSTDNGITWQQKVNGFPGPVFDDGTVTFAIANDGDIFASSFTDGVYRSTNNGETWINTNFPNAFIVTIVIDQNKRIYAGTGGGSGVFVSTNNGLNWIQKNNGLPVPAQISAICLTQSGELYAGIASGNNTSVYRSTDNAENWLTTNLTNANPDNIVSIGANVFAAAYSRGIYRTTNSGENWLLVNNGLTNNKINRLFINNSQILAASDSGVFRSTNNGNNWYKIGFNDKKITEVFITSNNTFIVSVFGEGIYRTTNNGTNWISSANGFNCNAVTSIAFSTNNIYAGLANNGLMRSSDNGNTWLRLYNGFKGSSCELIFASPNGYLFAQSDSGLFRSTNSGNNWVMLAGPFFRFNNIVSNQNGHLFASGSYPLYGVWRSTNNGASWDMPDPNFMSSIYSLCISQSGTLFSGSSGGGVYRSTNNGVNWIQSLPYAVVHSLTTSPNGNIFGHFDVSLGQDGIYRSTNNGLNWEYIGFGDNDYYTLKSNSAGHIFAGGFYVAGIYRSTNNGSNWTEVSSGIFNRMITTITFDNSGYSYAGTYYGGMYKTNISTIGIETVSSEIPGKFLLEQNYPNPFNPETKIKFGLPNSGNVKLSVYDASGRVVEELVNQQLNSGTFEVTWNGSNLSSGAYFYKLETDGFVETKKMIMIK